MRVPQEARNSAPQSLPVTIDKDVQALDGKTKFTWLKSCEDGSEDLFLMIC